MRYIKEYYNYDNQVSEICRRYNIENWSIRDGLVDVDGNVDLSRKALTKLPLKFGRVSGDFYCNYNQLTTLEGGPKEVGGWFDCYGNKLTTLEGSPKRVGGWFDCRYNQLTTLEGGPSEVSGDFNCSYNQLSTLEGGPIEVGGWFGCGNNKLTTLEGSPRKVGEDFYCINNQLTTLEHFPRVGGNIDLRGNPLPMEIWDNIQHLKKIIEYGPEYDIWRDGKLYLPRFNDMMIDIKEGL